MVWLSQILITNDYSRIIIQCLFDLILMSLYLINLYFLSYHVYSNHVYGNNFALITYAKDASAQITQSAYFCLGSHAVSCPTAVSPHEGHRKNCTSGQLFFFILQNYDSYVSSSLNHRKKWIRRMKKKSRNRLIP